MVALFPSDSFYKFFPCDIILLKVEDTILFNVVNILLELLSEGR